MRRPLALITGASRGIGKSIADLFAAEGYDLILTCKNNIDLLKDSVESYQAHGGQYTSLQFDIGNFAQSQSQLNKALRDHGHIDVLINNAGISYIGLITDMTNEQWQAITSTNLDSLFNTSKVVVPYMVRKKSGVILNISSIWGQQGASCEVAYSSTKGAMNSFTKALAKELAPSGIRVNAIACGAIDTEMNQWLDEDEKSALIEDIRLGRLGTSEEIAQTALFLTSDKASYITGQILTVDGGIE